MKDARGLEIGPPRPCPICGAQVATRPDGSLRAHSRFALPGMPRLGIVACEGGKRP